LEVDRTTQRLEMLKMRISS